MAEAGTALSVLWWEGNCHSEPVWLGFVQHHWCGGKETVTVNQFGWGLFNITGVVGRKLSQ